MNAALFIDVDNVYRSVKKKYQRRLNYQDYLEYIKSKFSCELPIKMAFGSQSPAEAKSFVSFLKSLGFSCKFEEGVDWNVSIAISSTELCNKVDVVVLGSNHRNLWPLLENLQSKGLRTFVFGCNIHPVLKNLSEYLEIDDTLLITEDPTEPDSGEK